MVLSDREIKVRAMMENMIVPFASDQVKVMPNPNIPDSIRENEMDGMVKVVSYGTSSYGYDMRIADEFKLFTDINTCIIDPKAFDEKSFVDFKGAICIMPPHSFILGRSVEYFKIPRDILTICLGKSTYARCGLIVNVTPLEPEWEGHVTIEISNTTPLPAKLYANEGIAQLIFIRSSQLCETSYKDKGGKYQAQKGVTVAKV